MAGKYSNYKSMDYSRLMVINNESMNELLIKFSIKSSSLDCDVTAIDARGFNIVEIPS